MQHTLISSIRYEGAPTKGSRFVVTMGPAAKETEAKELLASVRDEMSDASHHCWAWRLGVPAVDRAGDDGEPGGSAGRPMLAQLVGHDLIDVVAIVSRYFGGTKLGVGGLVRAYGGAVSGAIAEAELVIHQVMEQVRIGHEHSADRLVIEAVEKLGGTTVTVRYEAAVVRDVLIPTSNVSLLIAAIADATAGQATVRTEPANGG